MECGYRSSADSIVTKFPYTDGSRSLESFAVGISDGFTKVLLMMAVVAFCAELDIQGEELKQLESTLQSFKYVRCTYQHFVHPGHHFLNALSDSV